MAFDEIYEIKGYELLKNTGFDFEKSRDSSCATRSQVGYLMSVIENHKFKNGDGVRNVMEIGVCTGMSDLFMLKAGCKRDDFCLYGIEKGQGDFYGHIVYQNATEEEMDKWRFYPAHTAYDIESILGGGILDVVFIDGMHAHPGPLIDFLLLYPHMREDALVLFHDVETYTEIGELGACYFYTGWSGNKRLNYYVSDDGKLSGTEYMGILDIEREADEIFKDLLEIAKQPITGCKFPYCQMEDPLGIEYDDINVTLRNYMEKNYPIWFVNEIIGILIDNFNEYKNKWIYYKHQNRILDVNKIIGSQPEKISELLMKRLGNCRIAIWGAGKCGTDLVSELISDQFLNIAGWVDSMKAGGLISCPENLRKMKFDYLIIAVEAKNLCEEIEREALKLEIEKKKIKWIYNL